jgi:hypothetical protein
MMCLMVSGPPCQSRTSPLHMRGPRWQAVLFGFYAALLGLVLPLICWGALATPGHPHRTPHFVFIDPLIGQSDPSATPAAAHHHGGAMQTDEDVKDRQETRPVGRSSLSLLLFSILVFVVLGAWALQTIKQRSIALLHLPPFARSIGTPVPLPPPRLHPFAQPFGW